MATLQTVMRLSLQGGAETKRQLEDIAKGGDAAKAAFERMDASGKKIPATLRAVDTAAASVKGNLEGVAGRLGVLGQAANALGTMGTVAAAGAVGITAIGAGFAALTKNAFDAAGALVDAADATGVSIEQLQKYHIAAATAGVSSEQFNDALLTLNKNVGLAETGGGKLSKLLEKIDKDLLANLTSATSAGERFDLLAQKLATTESASQRVAIATAAGGTAMVKLLPLLKDGENGFTELGEAAERAGAIMSDDAARAADDAADKFTALGAVLTGQVNAAFIQTAPLIENIASAALGAIPSVVAFVNSFLPAATNVEALRRLEGELTAKRNQLENIQGQGFNSSSLQEEIAALEKDQARLRTLTSEAAEERKRANAQRIADIKAEQEATKAAIEAKAKADKAERESEAARKKAASEAEAAAKRAVQENARGLEQLQELRDKETTAALEGIAAIEAERDIAYRKWAEQAEAANLTQEQLAEGYFLIWSDADKRITAEREKEADKQAAIAERAAEKNAREAERALDNIRRDQEQLAETVGDALGDVLVDFVDEGKIEFEDLWRGFLNTGLRAIAQLAAQQIIIGVGVQGTGAGGATTGGSALGAGLGLLQQGQGLLGLGRTLSGGFSTLTDALGFTTSATTGLTSEMAYLASNGIDVAGLAGSNIAGPVAPASEQFAGTAAGSGASGLLLIPGLGLLSADMFDAAFGQGRFTASGGQLLNVAGGIIAGSAAVGATVGAGVAIAGSSGGILGAAGAGGGGAAAGAISGAGYGAILAAAAVIGLAIAKNLGAFKGPTGGTVARSELSGFLTQPDNGIPYFAGEDFYNDRGQAEANRYAEGLNRREPGSPGYQYFNEVTFSDWLAEEQRRHPESWMTKLTDEQWARIAPDGSVLPGMDYGFGADETRNRRANDTFYQGLEQYVDEKAGKIGLTDDQLKVGTGLTAGFRVRLGEGIDLQQPSRQMALLASLLGNIEDLGLDAAQAMEVFQAAAEQLGPGQTVFKDLNDFFSSQDNDLSIDVYRDSIQGLAQVYFNDLPRGVNASTVAMRELNETTDELGQQGTVSFNALKERMAAAVAEAEALEPALQQAFSAGLFDVELDEIEFADSIFDSLYEALKMKIADAAYEGLVDGIFTGDILGPFLKTFSETTAKVKSGEITQDEASVILATAAKDARDNLELLRPMILQAVESGRDLAAVFDDIADAGDDAADSLKEAFEAGIDRQILDILSPDLAAQYDLEVTQRMRLKAAREAGADLAKVEFLNGLEREALAEQQAERILEIERNAAEQIERIREQFFAQAERAIEGVADKLKAFQQTPSAAVTPEAALAAAQAEFTSLAAAARGGDLEAISDLPAAADTLAALITSLFGSTGQAAALLEPMFATLAEIAGLDPGAVKLSADAQAQIAAINADKNEQLAQAEKHHTVAVAIFEAMLADLDKLVGAGGESPSTEGTLRGDHIVRGVPGTLEPATGGVRGDPIVRGVPGDVTRVALPYNGANDPMAALDRIAFATDRGNASVVKELARLYQRQETSDARLERENTALRQEVGALRLQVSQLGTLYQQNADRDRYSVRRVAQ